MEQAQWLRVPHLLNQWPTKKKKKEELSFLFSFFSGFRECERNELSSKEREAKAASLCDERERERDRGLGSFLKAD